MVGKQGLCLLRGLLGNGLIDKQTTRCIVLSEIKMPLAKPEKIFTAILISIKDIDMLMRSCGNEKDNIKALRMIKEAQGLAYSIAGKLGYLKESVRKSNNLGEV